MTEPQSPDPVAMEAAGDAPAAALVSDTATTGIPTAHSPGEPEAIFVVGLSRSGTTLLRMVLGKHTRIAIADESHYLGHLLPGQGVRQRVRAAGDLREDATVRRLVDQLYSAEFLAGSRLRPASPFWRWLARRVPRDRLEQRLLAGERSERGVFTAVLQAYATRRQKPIFGEKTPAHLRFADTLFEWYPTAKVCHIVRDPRAVYVSELKRRRERPESLPYRWLVKAPPLMRAFVLLEVTWAWAEAAQRDRSLARRYPTGYVRVRFEDLVRAACPDRGAAVRIAGCGLRAGHARTEGRVARRAAREAGFDAGAADRWQRSISPQDLRWLQRLLGRRLAQMGYRAA